MSAQALLALDDFPADALCGFAIGWDHARHGLRPPLAHLGAGDPLGQGWRAGCAAARLRLRPADRHVRRWLALRTCAWREGRPLELLALRPLDLARLESSHCPVTRQPLDPEQAVLLRLREDAAEAMGHLVLLDPQAAQARRGEDWRSALDRAAALEAAPAGQRDRGLDAAAWRRLAVLLSFVQPLDAQLLRQLPLHVLPPPRLRLLNPAQSLQALLTRQLATPGFSPRLERLAQAMPDAASRHAERLVVQALLPRVLEAGPPGNPAQVRASLEDAWRCPRLQRAWQRLMDRLDAADCDAVLDRLAAEGPLGGVQLRRLSPEEATAAWGLAAPGQTPPQPLPPPVRAPRPGPQPRPAVPGSRAPGPLPMRQPGLPLH